MRETPRTGEPVLTNYLLGRLKISWRTRSLLLLLLLLELLLLLLLLLLLKSQLLLLLKLL